MRRRAICWSCSCWLNSRKKPSPARFNHHRSCFMLALLCHLFTPSVCWEQFQLKNHSAMLDRYPQTASHVRPGHYGMQKNVRLVCSTHNTTNSEIFRNFHRKGSRHLDKRLDLECAVLWNIGAKNHRDNWDPQMASHVRYENYIKISHKKIREIGL